MDRDESDLLDLALLAAPDRIVSAASTQLDQATREEIERIRRALATLGVIGEGLPSTSLRDRVLRSVGRAPRRALLVIDMVRDHLTPGSLLEVPRARAVAPAIAARVERARAEGTPIVFVFDQHERDDPDLDDWGTHNLRGSEGAQPWPGLEPAPGDRIVTKPSYSGFYRSNLQETLTELAVDGLILTGCLTEVQLQATAIDAMHQGFTVEIPSDAQAGLSAELEHAALAILKLMVPYALARRELLARLAA